MLSKIRGIGGPEFYVIATQAQAGRFHAAKAVAGLRRDEDVKTTSGANSEHHSRAAA
jgi:hypothetical protein